MDVFGGSWENYVDKLLEGFSVVEPDDTVILCGDLSWGMSLEQAEADFAFCLNIYFYLRHRAQNGAYIENNRTCRRFQSGKRRFVSFRLSDCKFSLQKRA